MLASDTRFVANRTRRTTSLSISKSISKTKEAWAAMHWLGKLGFLRFISMIAQIDSGEGPFGSRLVTIFRREQQTALSFHQCSMEAENGKELQDNG